MTENDPACFIYPAGAISGTVKGKCLLWREIHDKNMKKSKIPPAWRQWKPVCPFAATRFWRQQVIDQNDASVASRYESVHEMIETAYTELWQAVADE